MKPSSPTTMSALASLAWVSTALAARVASDATADASYLMLAAYALFGRRHAVEALALSWLFSMLNPGLAATAENALVSRYAILLAAALAVLSRNAFSRGLTRIHRTTALTLGLGLAIVVHAILFSQHAEVSVLKAVSWTLAMVTALEAWTTLTSGERDVLATRLFWGLALVLFDGIPLLASSVGYLRNETGFQGVLNHPQAFGITMALLGAWCVSRMLEEAVPRWSMMWLAAACVVFVVLSEARTGAFALLLGIGTALLTVCRLTRRPMSVVLPGLFSRRAAVIWVAAVAAVAVSAPQLERAVTDFVRKTRDVPNALSADTLPEALVLDAYRQSRGAKIEEMWANIERTPFRGIGFGVASDPLDMEIRYDPILGLPASASTEKSVMPIAVLEELGVFGFALVALWLTGLVRRSARGGIVPLAVTLTALLLNFGEATLFSGGGFGLLPLILIGWSSSVSPLRDTGGRRELARASEQHRSMHLCDTLAPHAVAPIAGALDYRG